MIPHLIIHNYDREILFTFTALIYVLPCYRLESLSIFKTKTNTCSSSNVLVKFKSRFSAGQVYFISSYKTTVIHFKLLTTLFITHILH